MIGKVMIAGGVWLITDCIYSITLYLNAPSYEGSPKQTFRRDHWVRLVRGLWGLTFVVMGFLI